MWRPRTGRRAAAPAATTIAQELRRRRETLHLTVRAAGRRCGLSPSVISEVETGRRVPSLGTWAKLRAGLGLDVPATALLPAPAPSNLLEEHLVRLAACLVLGQGGTLAALAEALDVSIAAVREGLSAVRVRLGAVGLFLVDDGAQVRVGPVPSSVQAVTAFGHPLQQIPELSAEQLEIIAIVAHHDVATRRQVEQLRGQDSESLLRRLVESGLLERVTEVDAPGSPNLYRITAAAVAATGHATTESLRGFLMETMAGVEGRETP